MNRIAIVGATSEVVSDLIDVLVQRGFDLAGLRVLGDENLAGEAIEAAGYDVRVEEAVSGSLAGSEVAMFFGDGTLARALVPEASAAGALVLDATTFARESLAAPLVLPEVNADRVRELGSAHVLAVPGPYGVGLGVALAPLHEAAQVRRVVATVFQSAALSGREAMDGLSRQTVQLMQGRGFDHDEFAEQLAFNARPQAAALDGGGWSVDERRLGGEIAALFGSDVDVVTTVVRVPVFAGAAMSVFVELERPLDPEHARQLLREGRGVVLPEDLASLSDEPSQSDEAEFDEEEYSEARDVEYDVLHDECPGPVEVDGSEAVHVARLRGDARDPRGLAFWVAFDDLRKGTSLNLVATLEIALRDLR